MTEDTMALIAQLEDRRYEAMLRGDVATLDHLLDDRLRYVHSNGSADGKASYLDGFRKGVWSYGRSQGKTRPSFLSATPRLSSIS